MGNSSKRQGGFTVTGMLVITVVVAMIVLIAVITIPNFVSYGGPSPANTCVNNLRQIDAAKEQWALETGITNVDLTPSKTDIQPYFEHGAKVFLPYCPIDKKKTFDSSYIMNNVRTAPQCRFSGMDTNHVLK